MNKILKFNPKARIIRTIGDQLISGPEAAVIELVKNSYDADASYVRVKFIPSSEQDRARIVISDDGHGMSLEDIHTKWMEPATSNKSKEKSSPNGRKFLGSKGIGRFAAAKLGECMALNSSTTVNGKQEEIIIPEIDWSIFSDDVYLSDISIEYIEQSTGSKPGTEIEIVDLYNRWTEKELRALHIELKKLISPLNIRNSKDDEEDGFSIYFDLSEFTDEVVGFNGYDLFSEADSVNAIKPNEGLEHNYKVSPLPLLSACDYEVQGEFSVEGVFSGTIAVHRAGQAPKQFTLNVPIREGEAPCSEIGVHLYIIDREGEAIKNTMKRAGMGEITAAKARHIVDEMCGVSIYKNNFRIRPYGDVDNDWLTLDTRRVQNPSLRIGHNQVAGYVTVKGESQSGLLEKSSREGFEYNDNFRRLKNLILALFSESVEPKRFNFRKNAEIGRAKDPSFKDLHTLAQLTRVKEFLVDLPEEKRKKAEGFIDKEAKKLGGQITDLEERQAILEAKSSMGLIVGEIMHEGGPATQYIHSTANKLRSWHVNPDDTSSKAIKFKGELPKHFRLLEAKALDVKNLFKNLQPLAGGKRGKPTFFNPVNVSLDVISLFDSHEDIEMGVKTDESDHGIDGYVQDLTTALVNLVNNSVYWLEHHQVKDPKINISIKSNNGKLSIFIEDNGLGVPEEFVEDIFRVSFSLKENGTGLGLNIAQEAISRSGGILRYHPEHKGGALFELQFNH